jgi:hypothetical protein
MKLPQLSLRELFWLVLVCALALGWWIDRSQLVNKYWGQWRDSRVWQARAESVGTVLCELEPGQWIEWSDDPDHSGSMFVKGPVSKSSVHGWKSRHQLAARLDNLSAAITNAGYCITWQPGEQVEIAPTEETP